MKRNSSEKRTSVYTLERKENKVGTEPIFIRSVPKEGYRHLWTLLYGTGKTGRSQVSFTRKNPSEPFQFFSKTFHFIFFI